jgi:hypothetical protein
MSRKIWNWRCLGGCGKMKLKTIPKSGLCPNCGEYCAPAVVASKSQAAALARKSWKTVSCSSAVEATQKLGLTASAPKAEFIADLRKITRARNDVAAAGHLIAHRHIFGRSGFCNGDFKSRSKLRMALRRGPSSPFFPRPSMRTSPEVMGKLVEAELELRAGRRCMKSLSLVSQRLVFQHPVLGVKVNVEIDGDADGLPVELKTVATLGKIPRKIFGMMMQLAGQAIAKGVDSGVLIIAERDGELLTAVSVSGLTNFHRKHIEKWASEASQEGAVA